MPQIQFFSDVVRLINCYIIISLNILQSHSRSLKMVLFKIFGTVSYSHSIATMVVSLAVLTQYTSVTASQTSSHSTTA